jgi:hypothetical protein
MKKIAFALMLVVLALPTFTLAHPGHGETGGYTIIHYLVEPVHAIVTIGIIVTIIAFTMYVNKNKSINK